MQQKAGTTNLTKNRIKPAVLLALAAVLVLAALAARVVFSDRKTEQVERDAYKLGTVVRISVYGQNRRLLDKAADDALERGVTRLENEFSVNIASSEISRINSASRGGRQITVGGVPYDTGYLVGRALEIARETGGAFDPTVYPIVKLWGIGTDHARVPSDAQIADARSRIGFGDVTVLKTNGTYEIKIGSQLRRQMALDLGGIAKGYVADVLAEMLRKDGIKCALIDLGGNIYVIGEAPQGRPWKLGIQHPHKPRGEYFGTVDVEDTSVVTSGPYERFFVKNGVRYHHIFDPQTGRPARSDLESVTIVSRVSANADALCTALFVMGFNKSAAFLAKHRDIQALLVRSDGTVFVTKGLESVFRLSDPSMKQETLK